MQLAPSLLPLPHLPTAKGPLGADSRTGAICEAAFGAAELGLMGLVPLVDDFLGCPNELDLSVEDLFCEAGDISLMQPAAPTEAYMTSPECTMSENASFASPGFCGGDDLESLSSYSQAGFSAASVMKKTAANNNHNRKKRLTVAEKRQRYAEMCAARLEELTAHREHLRATLAAARPAVAALKKCVYAILYKEQRDPNAKLPSLRIA
jgi:hypothetical protein